MRSVRRSLIESLRGEEREVRRRIAALRRLRHRRVGPPDLPADGSLNMFEVALGTSAEQHDEVLRWRLAEKSQALAEAMEQIREGTYGICRECGCRIPRRRLEVLPTATLCVACQAQREAAFAA